MPHNQRETIALPGVIPAYLLGESLIETVRDPNDQNSLIFLEWVNRSAHSGTCLASDGVDYVPPDPKDRIQSQITLPDGVRPCRKPAAIIADIVDTFVEFIDVDRELLLLAAALGLCSWFPDCLEAAPYLWIVGPLGSAKTKLLRLLSCICRRALLVGDVRAGSLYTLTDTYNPTLLIDELDLDETSRSTDILRLLRTGTVPGVPAVRGGKTFSTYGVKAVTSRQVPRDAALLSKCVVIPMLPTKKETSPLDDIAMRRIAQKFQPELLMFRFKNHSQVKRFRLAPGTLQDCTARTRQVAGALVAPILGDSETESIILAALRRGDSEADGERMLEPEWLVGEALFRLCHDGATESILVGGIAISINQKLNSQGEDFRIGARRVGWILKSLGVPAQRLGSLGRGIEFTPRKKRQVHAVARRIGISRATISTRLGSKAGYAGSSCALCDEFGLSDGLPFNNPGHTPPGPVKT